MNRISLHKPPPTQRYDSGITIKTDTMDSVKASTLDPPNESYPSVKAINAAMKKYTQRNFIISSCKLPISKSGAIDAMSEQLGIPIPEMIFGNNLVSIVHRPSNWGIVFTAYDALDLVDKTGANMLQVSYAKGWSESRESSTARGIREVVRPFDWSYSSTYKGTSLDEAASDQETQAPLKFQPSTKPIPLELLKRRDPILFHDEVILYESELDDNGISIFSVKFRVMEERMLLLCRLYMRLDDVVVRVRDTRVYVDFLTDEVIREFTAREEKFESVKQVSYSLSL
jgi:type 2A phosphatase activator TIP41